MVRHTENILKNLAIGEKARVFDFDLINTMNCKSIS